MICSNFFGNASAHRFRFIVAFLGISALGVQASFGADDSGEWKNLIEKGDLSKHWKTTGNWKIDDDGTIKLVPRKGEKGWGRFDAYLWYKAPISDFEINFEYKVQAKGNSGFYFRVGNKKNPVHEGIEVQIYDTPSRGAGHQLNDHDAGGIIPFQIPPKANAAKPAGQWHRFQISVRDDKLVVKLNGQLVDDLNLGVGAFTSRPKKGHIGFQDHGMPLELRNIRLRKF